MSAAAIKTRDQTVPGFLLRRQGETIFCAALSAPGKIVTDSHVILSCSGSIASKGRPRRFPKGGASPAATNRKPNESAETCGHGQRRLRPRTRPPARNLCLWKAIGLNRHRIISRRAAFPANGSTDLESQTRTRFPVRWRQLPSPPQSRC